MRKTYISKEVKIGNRIIGGRQPILVQSMTNTHTMDTAATVLQCKELADVGCEMIRITAPTVADAKNLENIKNELYKSNYILPLVADIHYSPLAAVEAAKIVEKVRINPGNYTDRNIGKVNFTEAERQEAYLRIKQRLQPLIEVCKANSTVIRIGVNHGSLSERIVSEYGNTPMGMLKSAIEFIDICEGMDFSNLVVSMKSSEVGIMDKAVRLFVEEMNTRNFRYPLHLGVTEAGNAQDARIISSIGIGSLLLDGIGDTIRVSLTEDPHNEIGVARQIIDSALKLQSFTEEDNLCVARQFNASNLEELTSLTSIAYGRLMLKGIKEGFLLGEPDFDKDTQTQLLNDIYQAAGVKYYKTRFVACPSCGRTMYDIQTAFNKVKERFSNYKGLKIAVMGCVVNGPGEMADADYGYIGAGKGLVNLYKKGVLVEKNIAEEDALDRLEKLILE